MYNMIVEFTDKTEIMECLYYSIDGNFMLLSQGDGVTEVVGLKNVVSFKTV